MRIKLGPLSCSNRYSAELSKEFGIAHATFKIEIGDGPRMSSFARRDCLNSAGRNRVLLGKRREPCRAHGLLRLEGHERDTPRQLPLHLGDLRQFGSSTPP